MADTQETLKCPACSNEMTKVFIAEKGINIDVCSNGCGGIFFDNKEIQEFSGMNEDISEIKSLLAGKNFMPVDERQTRKCPVCGINMAKTSAMGIEIDTCYKCGAIFLDNGEFELVRTKFKKRPKVTPVEYNPNSDIDIREFFKEAQQEELLKEEGYRRLNRLSVLGRRGRISLFSVLFDLFL